MYIFNLHIVYLNFDAVVAAASRAQYSLQEYGVGDYKAFATSLLNT